MPSVTLGNYLLSRLNELGITHIFGVPGEHNLAFLDQVMDHSELAWIGNCTQLNAAFAADGYARIRGAAALAITFGAGDLSAINGIAGSYAEQVPVIAITGMPCSGAATGSVHLPLADGDFDRVGRIFSEVTADRATLTRHEPTADIDRLLRTMWREKRPVHLNFPSDLVDLPVLAPGEPLISDAAKAEAWPQICGVLGHFLDHCAELLTDAEQVTVLAGHQIDRFRLTEELRRLLDAAPLHSTVLPSARGVVDESATHFEGVYLGEFGDKATRQVVEQANVLIVAGAEPTDPFASAAIHDSTNPRTIVLTADLAVVGGVPYEGAGLGEALVALVALFARRPELRPAPAASASKAPDQEPEAPLTEQQLWPRVASFLRPGDVLLAEQGTAFFGAQEIRLPTGSRLIEQPQWGSTGYTLPAALGAQLADPSRRCVLVIGDDSLQLTVQALGTMARYGAASVVIVLSNNGHSTDRSGHEQAGAYTIATWDHAVLPAALGAGDRALTVRATTPTELDAALEIAGQSATKLVLIEAVL